MGWLLDLYSHCPEERYEPSPYRLWPAVGGLRFNHNAIMLTSVRQSPAVLKNLDTSLERRENRHNHQRFLHARSSNQSTQLSRVTVRPQGKGNGRDDSLHDSAC